MPYVPREIDERAFRFFCGIIRFVRTIEYEPGIRRLADQMVGAAGSVAANREEAASGSSRREFIRYNEIALRSAKESVLWLRGCEETAIGPSVKHCSKNHVNLRESSRRSFLVRNGNDFGDELF